MATTATPADRPRDVRKCAQLNPATGWPLKPGQRLATKADASEAWRATGSAEGTGPFPSGVQWRLDPCNVLQWLKHDFQAMRSEVQRLAEADLNSDEFALLLWDLTMWWALALRWEANPGESPPPPEPCAYLRPGREHFGERGRMPERYTHAEDEARDAQRIPPPPIVDDTRGEDVFHAARDAAMLVLSLMKLRPADLVDLDLGDVDQERMTVTVRYSTDDRPDRVLELWDEAWFVVECYLDLLPDLNDPTLPLFPSRKGGRMSSSQARRIVYDDSIAH